jgi:RecB family endonuclease NucS
MTNKLTEAMMENAVVADPEGFLGEPGLKLVARQYRVGSYIFDLLFEDRRGSKLIVELQLGTLDRAHTYKILDYYDEYKASHPGAFIELMVVANRIPYERRQRLTGLRWFWPSAWDFRRGYEAQAPGSDDRQAA